MTKRFSAPPNWPTPPPGWRPPAGWRPDPHWGPAPRGWQFWLEEVDHRSWFSRNKLLTGLIATPLALVVGTFWVTVIGLTGTSGSVATPAMPTASSALATPSNSPSVPASKAVESSASASAQAQARAAAERRADQEAAQRAAANKAAAKKAAAKKAAAKRAHQRALAKKAAKARAAKARAAAKRRAAELAAERRADAKKQARTCTQGYSPCLPPKSDYDCSGGSGDGPGYVYGSVEVTGSDPYDLDRDGDGIGCD